MALLSKCALTGVVWTLFNYEGSSGFSPSTQPFAHRSFQLKPKQHAKAINTDPCGWAPAHEVHGGSPTALSANLFDRIARVAKGNINNVLKYIEDPEKIMNQALDDMQADLVKVRQSYAEITATQRRLMRKQSMADRQAEDWYARAQLALRQGNEGLARQALAQRQIHVETSRDIQSQLDSQAAAVDKLYEGMQMLESRILEAKGRKDQMVARARTAKSTQQVNDMLTGITGKTSMDAFKRMEEKVEALEAAAEVSSEMSVFGLPGGSSTSQVEKEFKLLEGSAEVDKELKKMKKNLLAPSENKVERKMGSKVPVTISVNIDSELEAMKKESGL